MRRMEKTLTDQQVWDAFQSNDLSAKHRIYEQVLGCYRGVIKRMLRIVGVPDKDKPDLEQEIHLKIWLSLPNFRLNRGACLYTYLYIVIRGCFAKLKKQGLFTATRPMTISPHSDKLCEDGISKQGRFISHKNLVSLSEGVGSQQSDDPEDVTREDHIGCEDSHYDEVEMEDLMGRLRLCERDKLILTMLLDGWTGKEIADAMGVGVNSIYRRVNVYIAPEVKTKLEVSYV